MSDARKLPDKVREYLEGIAGEDSIERLRHEVELWKDTADLNELWIADMRLEARQLLDEFASGEAGDTR